MDGMAHASVLASRPLGGMVPDPALLTPAHETEEIRADGRPQPAFREQLRKIPSWRNAWSVLSVWLQAALILGLAVWWGTRPATSSPSSSWVARRRSSRR